MDMSQTPKLADTQVAAAADSHAADPKADRRAEQIAYGIAGVLIAALAAGFLTLGVPGVGLVSLALVPVIYLLLIVMAGAKS